MKTNIFKVLILSAATAGLIGCNQNTTEPAPAPEVPAAEPAPAPEPVPEPTPAPETPPAEPAPAP